MISLSLGLSICAILFSFITLVISILSLSYVVGLKNSTHQIQFVPATDGMTEEETKEEFGKAFSTSFDDDEAVHV